MTTEADSELWATSSKTSITDEDGRLQEKLMELQASFNGQFIPAQETAGTQVATMLSSPPQQAVMREDRKTCLQWPDHLLLISIFISLFFFWMLPLNILSLVCSIIAVRAHRQQNHKLSRRYAFISKVVLLVTIVLGAVILTASLVISVGVLPRVTQEST